MQHQIAHILDTYHEYAIILSILISIFISIIGFIPSVFLTALNIKLFGLVGGFIVSLVGEALGALVSFWLYRLGFQYFVQNKTSDSPKVQQLLSVQGKKAFYLILSLRLVPFIPSSLVTLFAALGKISWISFALASTIGKIPALFLEIYSVNEVLNGSLIGKIILTLLSLGIFIYIWKMKKTK
ncbi:TVP38/TMEM64 family protein [Shimazuella alba]|uniref:TVP38/TMEM64 family membrane protein n=1 Tax=Shimazuella alba TaxID=2690964 RepID=A0A6I4VRV4_9BACL|nr:VTT domain-containing protein [Shimazuella alba]MXQ52636.1 TVP38/TMEM64 family protein [Shimazuella alba]